MVNRGIKGAWRWLAAVGLIGNLVVAAPAFAQDATWSGNPTAHNLDGNFDFNNSTNWTNPVTVPGSNTQTGTAFFGATNGANISFSAQTTTLSGFTFTAGAANYVFTVNSTPATFTTLNFVGAGGILVNGGSATINNNNGSTIQFGSAGGTDTASAGKATITNNNNSATAFAASTNAGSATITNINASFVGFVDSSSAGNAVITNNGGSNTQFGQFGGIDTASAGNATITNNGVGTFISFFANTTAGSATITNNNGGVTAFFDNSTAGNARLINNAGGTVDFSASAGPSGNNQLSAGSIEGAGVFFLGANQLTVGGNNLSTNVSGVISDCHDAANDCQAAGLGLGSTLGSLVKIGTGTLTLSGANTYTGATIVSAGTLEVDGSIASPLTTVKSGGTLSGTGTVGATRINNGGTLAPGNAANPTGTLTLNGSLVFQSAAVYLIGINGANAASTLVSGSATLTGASVSVASGSSISAGTKYTILTANSLVGTFNSNVSFGAFTGALSYDPTHAFLTFSGGGITTPLGLNDNQRNVSSSLITFFNNGGALPPAFFNLLTQTGAVLANGLTQISGEIAVGSQQTTFNAMGQFMELLTDPFLNRGGGFNAASGVSGYAEEAASAYDATNKKTDAFAMFTKTPSQPSPASGGGSGWGQQGWGRWSVWAAGFGGSQSTSGNAIVGSNNTTSNIAGTAVGADYLISPTTIAGFALAGGGTNFSVANGGTGRSDLFQIGAYVRHTSGPAYIAASLAYGWQDITHNRTVTVAGLDQLHAEFNANAFSGRLEGGYRFVQPWIGGIGITPYAAAQFVTFDLPRYAEQAIVGLNTFALNYGAHDVTDSRSELGVRTDKSWAQSDGILTLRGRFAWAHDFDPNRAISATFQSLPGASFVVNGAAQAADSALTTASIEKKWKNGWSAAATFEGEFSGVTSSYAGKGVVRYQW